MDTIYILYKYNTPVVAVVVWLYTTYIVYVLLCYLNTVTYVLLK